MVRQMNKTMFIKEISERCNLSIEDATLVNSVLEDNFFLSKSKRCIIINGIMDTLNIDIDKATNIYEECVTIASEAVKNKLKHPFRSYKK